MNPLVLANLALFVTVLSWGLPVPFFDSFFDRWDPILSSSIRYWIAIALLFTIWRIGRRPGESLKPPNLSWWPIWRLSAIGIVGFSLTYSFAMDSMHPVTAAVMSGTAPAISAAVSRLLFRVPLQRGFGLAIVCSLIGTAMTTLDFSTGIGGLAFQLRGGEPLFVLAQALWAWYSLEAQRLFPGVPQIKLTLCTLLAPAVILPLLYAVTWPTGLSLAPPAWDAIELQDIAVQLWVSVFGVAVAIVCWNYGVKHMGLVISSLYGNLVPICAILAALAIGVEPRWPQLVGGAIVVFGVVQAQIRLVRLRRAAAAVALQQASRP